MSASRIFSIFISKLREPKWGAVMFIITLVGGAATIIFTSGIGRMLSVGLGLVILAAIIFVNIGLKDVKMGFVQTQPTVSAEAQHSDRYPVSDGFAEFEVFLDISKWIDDFRIEVDTNGPFNINIWEGPAPIKLENQVIYITENLDEISFTLQFAADQEDLGEGSYPVDLNVLDTNRTLYSFSLNANPKLKTDHELDDLPSEAIDELDLEFDEERGTSTS